MKMKRLAYLLSAAIVMIFASCSNEIAIETADNGIKSVLPSALSVSIIGDQTPGTKATIGELDETTNTYPIYLTPEEDFILVFGYSSSADETTPDRVTCYAWYTVDSFENGVASLKREYYYNDTENETDYFVFTTYNENYSDISIYGGGIASNSFIIANSFTKDEFEDICESIQAGTESTLPLHVLNSIVKVHIDYSDIEDPLLLDTFMVTGSEALRGTLDHKRIQEMIEDKAVYFDENYDAAWYEEVYLDRYPMIEGSGSIDIYFPMIPSDDMLLNFTLNAENDDYYYHLEINANKEATFKAGTFYTLNIKIDGQQLNAGREFKPYISVDNERFRFSDTLYGDNNARFNTLLPSSDWVLVPGGGEAEDYTSDMSGKIAIVRRGLINFVDKVLYAEQAGASAIIIYNNQPGIINMDLSMLGSDRHIPVVSTTEDFGAYLADNPDAIINSLVESR